MKYIRTKNGIYDLSNKYSQTPEEVQIALMTGNYKQADTIEELCDEFVLHYEPLDDIPIPWASYERRSDSWNKNKEMLVKELKNTSGRKPIVRGAIYTDKGLIYVAKMNDKGELELL